MDQIKSYLDSLSQGLPDDLLPDRNVIPYSEYEDDFRLAFPYGEKQKIDFLIQNQKHLIILGDAGIGKSTLLKTIASSRKEELGGMISKYLIDSSPLSHIKWVSEDTFQVNTFKYENSCKCLRFIDHYNLKIADSDVLMEHLFFSEHKMIVENYFRNNGFKRKDLNKLDTLIDPCLPAVGLSALINFVTQFKIDHKNIISNLRKILIDTSRDVNLRAETLRAIIELSPPDIENMLDDIARKPQKNLSDIAIDELMKRQHLPTIMRLIDNLINGRLDLPEDSSWLLDNKATTWIQHITVDRTEIWKGLCKLVNLAIRRKKHQFLEVLSKTMVKINRRRTINYLNLNPA